MVFSERDLRCGTGHNIGAEFCDLVTDFAALLVIRRAAPFLNLLFAFPDLNDDTRLRRITFDGLRHTAGNDAAPGCLYRCLCEWCVVFYVCVEGRCIDFRDIVDRWFRLSVESLHGKAADGHTSEHGERSRNVRLHDTSSR